MGNDAPWPPPSLKPAVFTSNLARWEAFDWDRHSDLRAAKRVIVDWYNDLPDSGALVLAGDFGCGKTHIAEAVADLYGRWRTAFFEEIQLAKKIQATYGNGGQSEEDVWGRIFRFELFIFDDLGTYKTQNDEWITNLYDRIFNDYVAIRKRTMLITTNLAMFDGGLEDRIGPRSFSRLCGAMGSKSAYVDLFGVSDYRVERFLG